MRQFLSDAAPLLFILGLALLDVVLAWALHGYRVCP